MEQSQEPQGRLPSDVEAALTAEFDRQFEEMQTPEGRAALERAWNTDPADLATIESKDPNQQYPMAQ